LGTRPPTPIATGSRVDLLRRKQKQKQKGLRHERTTNFVFGTHGAGAAGWQQDADSAGGEGSFVDALSAAMKGQP